MHRGRTPSLPSPLTARAAACVVALAALGCGDSEASGGHGSGGAGGGHGTAGVTRIAFGSCMHQDAPKPALDRAVAAAPDLFVFLGDNMYGDSDDVDVLAAAYAEQALSPELGRLRDAVPVIATWDDHDFGRNDAGKEYPAKAGSKALFLSFWDVPSSSPRRARDGLYDSYVLEDEGHTVQLLLLDTRWFRDPLDPNDGSGMNDYVPTGDTSRTLLGAEQWAWLEGELAKPADLRVIASSIQLGHSYNGYESWTNLPHERERLVDVLRSSGATSTVVISGDAHWAELSRFDPGDGGFPLYDLTSSGITEEWAAIPPNDNRVGEPIAENNFGLLEIAWGASDHTLTFGIVDAEGVERLRHAISTSELR